MQVVIAMDAFKSCISAAAACEAVSRGVKSFNPDIQTVLLPISDGSEGFLDVITPTLLKRGYARETIKLPATPYSRACSCDVLRRGNKFILEMATVCGQRMFNEVHLNPYRASSYPLGLLLKEVIERGGKLIKLGLGACATHDLGLGMLSAMGCRFFDKDGQELDAKSPSAMRQISAMDSSAFDNLTKDCVFEVCYDMQNPLFGPAGATYSFAMQKGASRQDLPTLENLLKGFYELLSSHFKRDVRSVTGTGSAGGLGAAVLTCFEDSRLYAGVDFVLELMHIQKRLASCDLVFVGEGMIDEQNATGKSLGTIAAMAKQYGVKVVALCGMNDQSASLREIGVDAVFSICNRPMTKNQSIINAEQLLSAQAANVISLLWGLLPKA